MSDKQAAPREQPGLAAKLLAAAAVLVGASSLLLFAVFLYAGSLHVIDLKLGAAQLLLFDALLCLLFFAQHSGMIRKSMRRRLSLFMPEHYHGAAFTLSSALALFALVALWQEASTVIGSAEGAMRWTLRAVFFAAVVMQAWGTWSLKSADLFGAKALAAPAAAGAGPTPMVIRGPYRWVRHPLYSTTLLMIWSYPDLTADRLLLNMLFTVWIAAGAVLEERDLVDAYGEAYRDYQRRVPMLIPRRRPL